MSQTIQQRVCFQVTSESSSQRQLQREEDVWEIMMGRPILIYDNLCTSCTNYAKLVDKLTNGQIQMLGHYTADGKEFKAEIFPKGYEGLDMSWFVDEKKAYGGRRGLIKIMQFMFNPLRKGYNNVNKFDLTECTTDCRSVKGVMIRSCSILTEGKVIEIGN